MAQCHSKAPDPLWLLKSKAGFFMQCSYMHSIGSHNPSLLYGPQPSVAHPYLSLSTPVSPFYFQISCVLLFSLILSPKIIFIFIFSFFLVLASITPTSTLKNILFYWNTIAAYDIKQCLIKAGVLANKHAIYRTYLKVKCVSCVNMRSVF